jgi:hypothetical protein
MLTKIFVLNVLAKIFVLNVLAKIFATIFGGPLLVTGPGCPVP